MRFHGKQRGGSEEGQSTVEAAFVAPIVMGLVLALAQPCIVLYDRIVMESAAAEGCRLMATLAADDEQVLESFVRRRLAAVPQQDCFHVHGSGCSWEISVQGDRSSEEVEVTIENKIKPLPLIGFLCQAAGATDADGCWSITVSEKSDTQPDWAWDSPAGADPSSWVGGWL